MLRALQIANIVGLVLTLFSNVLANTIPIGGITTGDVADSYSNLFAPAGLTFSIWGVIYVLLLVFTIYQGRGLFGQAAPDESVLRAVGPWFLIAGIANASWIFAFHYRRIPLSTVLIVALLIALLIGYLRLGIGMRRAERVVKLAVFIPFSVYIGWVIVATAANVTLLLVDLGWGGFGLSEQFWAIVVIAVGALVGLYALFARADIPLALVVVWAYAGIVIKRAQIGDAPGVVVAAAGAGAILLIDIAIVAVRRGVYTAA